MYKTRIQTRKCLDCDAPFDDDTFLKYRYLCTMCSSERKRIKKSFEIFLKDFDKDLDLETKLTPPTEKTDPVISENSLLDMVSCNPGRRGFGPIPPQRFPRVL
jgi:hypothetical protein